jgi:G3E family GTPase
MPRYGMSGRVHRISFIVFPSNEGRQVAMADRLLLNKIDLVTDSELDDIEARLR